MFFEFTVLHRNVSGEVEITPRVALTAYREARCDILTWRAIASQDSNVLVANSFSLHPSPLIGVRGSGNLSKNK